MVKINKIYTRTGDDGTTGLVGGSRVPKDSIQVDAYGEVDELNSAIGLARTVAASCGHSEITAVLEPIQNALFDLGSVLASPPGEIRSSLPRITPEMITDLESRIDVLAAGVPELRSFVLPGGTLLNGHLHLARAVCRRAERTTIRMSRHHEVDPVAITYLNRLSDLLFALARRATVLEGGKEFLWDPGAGAPK